jgi:membrane fusion protein (multidrug efflux system)
MTVSTPIKVLSQNDGQNFVVTEGLKAGDRVVVEGVGTKVREGIQIQPVDAAKAAAQAEQAQQAAAQE